MKPWTKIAAMQSRHMVHAAISRMVGQPVEQITKDADVILDALQGVEDRLSIRVARIEEAQEKLRAEVNRFSDLTELEIEMREEIDLLPRIP